VNNNTLNNVFTALNILMDIYSLGSEILLTLKKSITTGQDITEEQIQDIISQRNQILDDLKAMI